MLNVDSFSFPDTDEFHAGEASTLATLLADFGRCTRLISKGGEYLREPSSGFWRMRPGSSTLTIVGGAAPGPPKKTLASIRVRLAKG